MTDPAGGGRLIRLGGSRVPPIRILA